MDKHEQFMRDSQYRKSRSIAFFNATNSAIELLKSVLIAGGIAEGTNPESIKTVLVQWRDWFLAEYDKDYKANVMTIGLPPQVMQGLDEAKKEYGTK